MTSPADSVALAVTSIEASRIELPDQNRAQQIADLFAWCGEGVIAPRELHAYLRPDTTSVRPRASGLLLRSAGGHRYVATTCHVISDTARLGSAQHGLMEPELSEDADGPGVEGLREPKLGMIELTFNEVSLGETGRTGLFPAAYFADLELSVVRLDGADSTLCEALEGAGFAFISADRLRDQPSGEGAEIQVLALAPPSPAGPPLAEGERGRAVAVKGRVSGLRAELSFYWTDAEVPFGMSGAPVIEAGDVVGLFSPRLAGIEAGTTQKPFGAITKGAFLKALLAAHEGANAS